jgi:hypothetical protein
MIYLERAFCLYSGMANEIQNNTALVFTITSISPTAFKPLPHRVLAHLPALVSNRPSDPSYRRLTLRGGIMPIPSDKSSLSTPPDEHLPHSPSSTKVISLPKYKRNGNIPSGGRPLGRQAISSAHSEVLGMPAMFTGIVRNLALLPMDVITMVGKLLKDEGEHLLLATIASVSSSTVQSAFTSAYKGRLELNLISTRQIATALPLVPQHLYDALSPNIGLTYRSLSVETLQEGAKDLWPYVPCPSARESREKEITIQGWTSTLVSDKVRRCMLDNLAMVRYLDVTDLPCSEACRIIIAVSRTMKSREILFSNVKHLRLGPGVFDKMVDWKDRHDGARHPLQQLYTTVCAPIMICVDYTRFLTENTFVSSRLGDTPGIMGAHAQERRRILKEAWHRYDRYYRRPNELLFNLDGPGTQAFAHHAEYIGASRNMRAPLMSYFSPDPLRKTPTDTLSILTADALRRMWERSISKGPVVLALPMVQCDEGDGTPLRDPKAVLTRVVLEGAVRNVDIAVLRDSITNRVRQALEQLSIISLDEAPACAICGKK